MVQEFRVEPIRPSDREAVARLTGNIWEGRDYIPSIFDEWLRDGGFYGGWVGDRLVALNKYTWQPNRVIWLEGLRVDPELQGRGYGRLMADAVFEIVKGLDCAKLKFMSAEGNKASIHMGLENGFRKVCECYHLELLGEGIWERTLAHADVRQELDVDGVVDFVLSSEEYEWNGRQYFAFWTALDMDRALIAREVEAGSCHSVRKGGKIDALAFFHRSFWDTLSIAFMAGSSGGMEALIEHGIHLCSLDRCTDYSLKTASEGVRSIAEGQGMREGWYGKVHVYDLVLQGLD